MEIRKMIKLNINENNENLKQILINAKNASKICSKCGYKFDKHLNASCNIAKRTIEILKK